MHTLRPKRSCKMRSARFNTNIILSKALHVAFITTMKIATERTRSKECLASKTIGISMLRITKYSYIPTCAQYHSWECRLNIRHAARLYYTVGVINGHHNHNRICCHQASTLSNNHYIQSSEPVRNTRKRTYSYAAVDISVHPKEWLAPVYTTTYRLKVSSDKELFDPQICKSGVILPNDDVDHSIYA